MSEVTRISDPDRVQPTTPPDTSTEPAPVDAPPPAEGGTHRRWLRRILMGLIPALLVAGAVYAYLQAGRFESTENAYVKAHIVYIAPEVSGTIEALMVEENDQVEAGAPLYRLRDEPFRIAIARAEAALAGIASEIEADRIGYQRATAEIRLHQSAVDYARVQLKRQMGLRAANMGSEQDLDAARFALDSATRQLDVARQEAARLLARLNGDPSLPVAEHPRYRTALAELERARLDLERTLVRAPVSGVVGRRPELGDYVGVGSPSMVIVSDEEVWVEANFKETQLTHMQPGQPVEIRVDAYPGRIWQGHIESIAGATGAEFALLPPQNATGNWVKVVQRVPVRVAVDDAVNSPALRVGMSSTVTVDTGHQRTWRDLLPHG